MVSTSWYVVPSTEHYRCQKCYIPRTFGIRNDLTVDWFPHSVTFPKVTTGEYFYQTTTGMIILIQGTLEHPIASLTYVLPLTNVHIQIAYILKGATARPLQAAPLPPEPILLNPILIPPPAV